MDYLKVPAWPKLIIRNSVQKKKKSCKQQQLSLTHDALLCYMKTVNYVAAAIQELLILFPVIPSPMKVIKVNGWIIKDSFFQIQWMLWKLFPEELFELISWSNHKSKCLGSQCIWRSHRLPCTDLCNCDSCENEDEVEIMEDELEYESSDNDWTIDNDCLVWNYIILLHP